MHKIFIIEVLVYVIGFSLCLSSLLSTDWFNLTISPNYKINNINNVTGQSIDLFRVCTRFANGTKKCLFYSCSNSSETEDFCEDIKACRFGLLISTISLLIICIMSLIRCILICYNAVGQEGICTIINIIFGMVAFIGTAIGIGYGAYSMPDLLKSLPPGLFIITIGPGYIMVIISFICALLCILLQYISCCNRFSRKNQPQIIYHYLPQTTDQQYINPLFQGNIIQQLPPPPPSYSSKA
jgi:hypothetical protein